MTDSSTLIEIEDYIFEEKDDERTILNPELRMSFDMYRQKTEVAEMDEAIMVNARENTDLYWDQILGIIDAASELNRIAPFEENSTRFEIQIETYYLGSMERVHKSINEKKNALSYQTEVLERTCGDYVPYDIATVIKGRQKHLRTLANWYKKNGVYLSPELFFTAV